MNKGFKKRLTPKGTTIAKQGVPSNNSLEKVMANEINTEKDKIIAVNNTTVKKQLTPKGKTILRQDVISNNDLEVTGIESNTKKGKAITVNNKTLKKRLTPKGTTIIRTDVPSDSGLEVMNTESNTKKDKIITINDTTVKKQRIGVPFDKPNEGKTETVEEHITPTVIEEISHVNNMVDFQDFTVTVEEVPIVESLEDTPTDIPIQTVVPVAIEEISLSLVDVVEQPVEIEEVTYTEVGDLDDTGQEEYTVEVKQQEEVTTSEVQQEKVIKLEGDELTELQDRIENERTRFNEWGTLCVNYSQSIKCVTLAYCKENRKSLHLGTLIKDYKESKQPKVDYTIARELYNVIDLLQNYKGSTYRREISKLLEKRYTVSVNQSMQEYVQNLKPVYEVDITKRTSVTLSQLIIAYNQSIESKAFDINVYRTNREGVSVTPFISSYVNGLLLHKKPQRDIFLLSSKLVQYNEIITSQRVSIQVEKEQVQDTPASIDVNMTVATEVEDILSIDDTEFKHQFDGKEGQLDVEEELYEDHSYKEESQSNKEQEHLYKEEIETSKTQEEIYKGPTEEPKNNNNYIGFNKENEKEQEHFSKEETKVISEESKEIKAKEQTTKDDGVLYEKGMTLLEFLKANPSVRKAQDVAKYFSTAEIAYAVKHGQIFHKKGKLII